MHSCLCSQNCRVPGRLLGRRGIVNVIKRSYASGMINNMEAEYCKVIVD